MKYPIYPILRLSLALYLIVALLLFAGPARSQNPTGFVLNSSFTAGGGVPDGWRIEAFGDEPKSRRPIVITRDTRIFASSPASLRLQAGVGADGGMISGYNLVPQPPSKRARFRFRLKSEGRWDWAAVVMHCRLPVEPRWGKEGWLQEQFLREDLARPGWHEYRPEFTLPDGVDSLILHFIFKGQGTVWIDDLSVEPVSVQVEAAVPGRFLYRFLNDREASRSLAAFPEPIAGTKRYMLAVPQLKPGLNARLEVVNADNGTSALLAFPFTTLQALKPEDFRYARVVQVPVRAGGKPVQGVTVTLSSPPPHQFDKPVTLKAEDGGLALFHNVPLDAEVTLNVRQGGHTPMVQKRTLRASNSAEGYLWEPVSLPWNDVKTLAPEKAAPLTATPIATSPASSDKLTLALTAGLALVTGISGVLLWLVLSGRLATRSADVGATANSLVTAPVQPGLPGGVAASPLSLPTATAPGASAAQSALPVTAVVAIRNGHALSASGVPRLVGIQGMYHGQEFTLTSGQAEVGRDTAGQIVLVQEPSVSRRHASLVYEGGRAAVIDHNSANGTFVNGVRIASNLAHPIAPGDEVQFGGARFRFEVRATAEV